MLGGDDVDNNNNNNINKNNKNDDDDIHNRQSINVYCAGRRHLYQSRISDICCFAQAHSSLFIYSNILQPHWAITGLGYTQGKALNIYRYEFTPQCIGSDCCTTNNTTRNDKRSVNDVILERNSSTANIPNGRTLIPAFHTCQRGSRPCFV